MSNCILIMCICLELNDKVMVKKKKKFIPGLLRCSVTENCLSSDSAVYLWKKQKKTLLVLLSLYDTFDSTGQLLRPNYTVA